MIYQKTFPSPIGLLLLQASDAGITALRFLDEEPAEIVEKCNTVLAHAATQLAEYFAGNRLQFELPLAQAGTPFQQQVWQLLTAIPYGTTLSYQALSQTYGDVKAIRAIAAANGKNNIAIIVPCHRVVGSNGELTGFAWGLDRKRWLLAHEARYSGKGVQASLFDR